GMDGLLQRIDGMHAIALLDRKARTLWLARDRFGEKPLFVKRADGDGGRHDDPRFVFASSLKALGLLVGRRLEIDPAGAAAWLAPLRAGRADDLPRRRAGPPRRALEDRPRLGRDRAAPLLRAAAPGAARRALRAGRRRAARRARRGGALAPRLRRAGRRLPLGR